MSEPSPETNVRKEDCSAEHKDETQQESRDATDTPLDSAALASTLPGMGDAINPELLDQIAELEMAGVVQKISEDSATVEKATEGEVAAEHLEEIAKDMLTLMRRMSSVEEGQQTILGKLEGMQESWPQSVRTIAREVDTLRRDMVGDRKHTSATSIFNELIPMIDRLQTMRSSLDGDDDSRMLCQVDGVLKTLSACLRRLGCEEFVAQAGSPFDPSHMECEAHICDGEPGVVLESVRPGYLFGEFVMRPAAVKVGAALLAAHEKSGDDSNE